MDGSGIARRAAFFSYGFSAASVEVGLHQSAVFQVPPRALNINILIRAVAGIYWIGPMARWHMVVLAGGPARHGPMGLGAIKIGSRRQTGHRQHFQYAADLRRRQGRILAILCF